MAEADAELLLDPAVQADPFPYYDQLRKQQHPGRPVERNHGLLFYSFKALPIQFTGVTPRAVRPE
jgi:hypothetical protein